MQWLVPLFVIYIYVQKSACYLTVSFRIVVNMLISQQLFVGSMSDRVQPWQIYLIAEDRILQVIPSNIGTSEARVKIFFGQNSTVGGSGEIIGLSISIMYSSLFITVKNRGLFAILLRGELLWSAGPVLYRFGYRQGCKKNTTDCYFSSPPIVDQCEGSLYVRSLSILF